MKTRVSLALLACVLLAACSRAPKPAEQPAAAMAPVAEPSWLRTEMTFGIAPADAEGLGLAAAEGTWRSFVTEEVASRFSRGFTVQDGQYFKRGDKGGAVERELGKVLVLVHPDTPEQRAAVEAVCAAYKTRFGEEVAQVLETQVRAPRR